MNFLGALLSFFMGLYGVAYVGAAIVAPDAGGVRFAQTAPQQGPGGGGMMGSPSGGAMNGGSGMPGGSPGGGGMMGSPSGGSFGDHQPPSGGMMGGQQGGQQWQGQGGDFKGGDMKGGQGMMGGNQGNQQWQGREGGQGQQGGEFGGQGGQGMMGGKQGNQGNQQWGGQGGEGGDHGGQWGGQGGEQDEEMMKKQQEEQDKQCLKQMLKGASQMGRPIKELEAKIAKIKKQGATPPASAQEAVDKMKASLQALKDAKTCDEAQAAQEELSGGMEDMQDLFQQLEFAAQAPKIIKQIKQGFGMMDKMWKKALAGASKSKVDLSEQVAKGQAIVNELKAMFDQMIAAVNSGDFEQMQNMMEAGDGAEEKRQELEEVIQTIEAVRNTGQMIKGLNQHLNGLKQGIAQAKRQKKDVTEINACVAAGKTAVDAVKAAAATKPVDLDALIDTFEGANDILGQCDDLIGAATGQEEEGIFDDFFGGDVRKQIESRPRQQQGGEESGGGQFGGGGSFGGGGF